MIGLTYLNELILTKPVVYVSALFGITGTFSK